MSKLKFNNCDPYQSKRKIDSDQIAIDSLVARWEIIDQAVMQLDEQSFDEVIMLIQAVFERQKKRRN